MSLELRKVCVSQFPKIEIFMKMNPVFKFLISLTSCKELRINKPCNSHIDFLTLNSISKLSKFSMTFEFKSKSSDWLFV